MLVTELSSRQAEGSGGFVFFLSPITEQQTASSLLFCKRPSLKTWTFPSRGAFGLAMVALRPTGHLSLRQSLSLLSFARHISPSLFFDTGFFWQRSESCALPFPCMVWLSWCFLLLHFCCWNLVSLTERLEKTWKSPKGMLLLFALCRVSEILSAWIQVKDEYPGLQLSSSWTGHGFLNLEMSSEYWSTNATSAYDLCFPWLDRTYVFFPLLFLCSHHCTVSAVALILIARPH